MKRPAMAQNEVKTRLDDRTYEALIRYKALYGHTSDAQALARLVGTSLLGVVGILPEDLSGVSANSAQIGPTQ